MKGTFQYCRTKDAIEWLKAGDIIQNIETDEYFKMKRGQILVSDDSFHWNKYNAPIEVFPPFVEWRSLSDLHYYSDLKRECPDAEFLFLSKENQILTEDDNESDKSKKRWFLKSSIEL